jgi:hypothetical protein
VDTERVTPPHRPRDIGYEVEHPLREEWFARDALRALYGLGYIGDRAVRPAPHLVAKET